MAAASLKLSTPVQYVKGVGPVRAQQLRRLGIETVEDLIHHFPHDYLERGRMAPLRELRVGHRVTTQGRVLDVHLRTVRHRRTLLTAMFGDERQCIRLQWFNAPFLADRLHVGDELVVSGEITRFGGELQMVNPQFEAAGEAGELAAGHPLPQYPLTAGLKQTTLRRLVRTALEAAVDQVDDPLRDLPQAAPDLARTGDALRAVHRPTTMDDARRGRERLAFDEALALQLAVGLRRARYLRRQATMRLDSYGDLSTRLVEGLGFSLTGAQRRALAAIGKDLQKDVAMHRLLQGDVGCGKTLVALIAMVWMAEAGGQAAFLAPTEVLARQHGARQGEQLQALGLAAATLTGSTGTVQRREILTGLRSGTIPIVFGTHALLEENVGFRQLGLAVVDEQHRFGVLQRASLSGEGAHLLVMSATPIPRSLALTVYGDLDLSVIDELPAGRPEVTTDVLPESELPRIYEDVVLRAQRGERSFLVFPLVEESEGSDLSSARTAFEELSRGALSELRLGLLHGKLAPREKNAVSEAFAAGELDALVATTVVEVGLDVPEATLMVIHQAERFGLAQLHQLRGRVGRGTRPSRCSLVMGEKVGERAAGRLRQVQSTRDGFRLAEADLRERGMGDLYGVRQHGLLPLKLLNPLQDEALIRRSRDLARSILAADPQLRRPAHRPLAAWLDGLGRRSPFWSAAG